MFRDVVSLSRRRLFRRVCGRVQRRRRIILLLRVVKLLVEGRDQDNVVIVQAPGARQREACIARNL